MSQFQSDLSVRQHTRYRCDIASRVRLDDADAACVKLSPAATSQPGTLDARVTDASRGGLGLSSLIYLPPGTRLSVAFESGGVPSEMLVKVQRVRMLDRKPTYYIGTSFSGSSTDQARAVDGLLARFAAPQQSGEPASAGAGTQPSPPPTAGGPPC